MLGQAVYTVGTAATTVVAPTVDSARYVLKNIEPEDVMGQLARDGYVYAAKSYFQIANNGTASFSFTTGPSSAQFEFWVFDSSTSSVIGELVEGASIVTTGAAIPGYNLNRNISDAHQSVLQPATSVTGGTVVYSNYIGASQQASGGAQSNAIVTLEPNTQYGFRFRDVGGQGTYVHAIVAWAEKFNGLNEIWLGTPDNSFVLRGNEEISMYLRPYETINARATRDGCRLAVMRQD